MGVPETEAEDWEVPLDPEVCHLLATPRGGERLTRLCRAGHLQALRPGTDTQSTRLAAAPRHAEFIARVAISRLVHILGRLPPVSLSRVAYFERERLSPTRADETQNEPSEDDKTHTKYEYIFWLPGPHENHLQRLKLLPHKR